MFYLFRYASLFFCLAIEKGDNELITLEVIHRYVEVLDKYFGNVSFTVFFIVCSFLLYPLVKFPSTYGF